MWVLSVRAPGRGGCGNGQSGPSAADRERPLHILIGVRIPLHETLRAGTALGWASVAAVVVALLVGVPIEDAELVWVLTGIAAVAHEPEVARLRQHAVHEPDAQAVRAGLLDDRRGAASPGDCLEAGTQISGDFRPRLLRLEPGPRQRLHVLSRLPRERKAIVGARPG